MLTVWLARHGEAVDPEFARSDYDRALTENGRQRLVQTTQWLLRRQQSPQLILHSPLIRARQTAETIAREVGVTQIRSEHCLAPGLEMGELFGCLSGAGVESIVCVGHQPDMSRCAADMIGGGMIHYSPGTIAGIVFHGPILRGAGLLQWLVDPCWFE